MADATNIYDDVQTPVDGLPEYDESAFDDEYSTPGDTAGLRVNFSKEEATSEAREYTLLPKGTYVCTISDVQLKRSTSDKHSGKPYYAMQLTINQGKYQRRKLFSNVMLFDGALYSLAQLLKALDYPLDGSVPEADWFLGKVVACTVQIQGERKKNKEDPRQLKDIPDDEKYAARNDVGGFKKPSSVLNQSVDGADQSQVDELAP